VNDPKELLILRGEKLHTRHQIEKLLKRVSDPVLVRYAVNEILTGNDLSQNRSKAEERARLLKLILDNPAAANFAEKFISEIRYEIRSRYVRTHTKALRDIPNAKYPFEVVIPRLETIRNYEVLESVYASLNKKSCMNDIPDIKEVDIVSIRSLQRIQLSIKKKILDYSGCQDRKEYTRHLFRQLRRIYSLLDIPYTEDKEIYKHWNMLESEDQSSSKQKHDSYIIKPHDGALGLVNLIGYKAANLAELAMLGDHGFVPSWFVITDKAFKGVLKKEVNEAVNLPGDKLPKGMPLIEVIEKIIKRNDLSNKDKSLYIRNIWSSISLPDDIKQSIIQAYHELNENPSGENIYIAIRSSSCEEDAEIAARAGEFETYLFIQGEDLLIEYLKRTWSGLWTERAIHNRSVISKTNIESGGGVIVQKIVWSRVSGVLQTINVPKVELGEIVINAGLGLGEGIVSGKVTADQIIVLKEGDLTNGPLHFNYITADKKEQVLFNKKTGCGTILTPTLYHQRFRPALEYIELGELVSAAAHLEAAYGYPLDIEYGIEDTRLWILQVRPVATFLPALKETLDNYPLVCKRYSLIEEKKT
jgi:phosphoenolpyruvate synthase/pyruvate phosphate dikinase